MLSFIITKCSFNIPLLLTPLSQLYSRAQTEQETSMLKHKLFTLCYIFVLSQLPTML